MLFSHIGSGYYSSSYIDEDQGNKYLSITLNQAAKDSGVRISAQDGSSFGIKSLKLIVPQSLMADVKVIGYDSNGSPIASKTFNTALNDPFGSVQFSPEDGTLTFNAEWKNVSAVSLIKPTEGNFYFSLDDIVLQTNTLQFAANSDTGVKGDAITKLSSPALEGYAEASVELDVYLDDASVAFATVDSNAEGYYSVALPDLDDGEHTVTVRLRNSDDAGTSFTFTVDTKADAPAEIGLDSTYAIGDPADKVTSDFTPDITGTAEKGATVTLYNGEKKVGEAVANSLGNWKITTTELNDGPYSLTARQVDVAGNESAASAPLEFTVKSGRPSTPVLSESSDSGVKDDGITNDVNPTFTGTAAANATVSLLDSTGKVLGIGSANGDGNWSIRVGDNMTLDPEDRQPLKDGNYKIHAQVLAMGQGVENQPVILKSGIVRVEIDTVNPDAPHAPALAEASDSGTKGDNITNVTAPTLNGYGADAYGRVAIYADGKLVASTKANEEGVWSVKTDTLAVGKHTLTAVQFDAAGNVSQASEALELTVERAVSPTPTPIPPAVDNSVPVLVKPVTLPGGTIGREINVPIVTAGQTGASDISLVSSGGKALLTANLDVGLGLSASGGLVSGTDTMLKTLIGMIEAANKTSVTANIAKMIMDGEQYLDSLAIAQSLVVETMSLTGTTASSSAIDLVGIGGGQQIAVVVDGAAAPAATGVNLSNIDFAAIIGAINVHGGGNKVILSGDNAAQGFTVGSNGSKVFAGGGADMLNIDFGSATSAAVRAATVSTTATVISESVTTTLLHGGAGLDTAAFAGTAADYTIAHHGGYTLVSSKAAPDQVAKVVNVESLRFSDGVIAVESDAALHTLAGLYQDVLGRQADADGFAYWADRGDAGLSLGGVALELLSSAEGVARLGALDGNAAHDIGLLYRAVFDRTADAGGLDFWTGHMDKGMTLQEVADQLMHSAEIVGRQLDVADWDFTV
ncbi:hypothetical protein NM04_05885 [Massilia aurea]|uniref:DUF4214 domain-containing protein n=1 Tax=Massilia aurea TaxID=373040 RepID=A0A422QNV2_9BURK|nr:Ig-like domain-containing protein [Massilia aurea]RNF31667.1 hypothetical protein NM04_05885 [Massilia aurea]